MQGWFDVEVQAKTVRAEMQRVAERQRMIDEALSRGQRVSAGHEFSIARLLGGARAWLAARRAVETPIAESVLSEPAAVSLILATEQRIAPRPRPAASSELYSGMVVLARGKQARSPKAVSGARER